MPRNPSSILVLLLVFSSVLLTSFSQVEFCEDYVTGNQVVVNQTLIEELGAGRNSLQRLVECLTNGGLLIFEESLEVETLEITSSISIQGSSGEATASLTCRDGPIFLVNATGVRLSNLEVRDCRLNSTEDAPVTVRSGSSLALNSTYFTNNTNAAGSASMTIETNSELTVQDCYFRRNSGLPAHIIEAAPGSNITITRSVFEGNTGNGSTIHVTEGNTLTVSNSTFVHNTASLGGGALQIESERRRSTVVIDEGSKFEDNEAIVGEGGAILATGNVRLTVREDTAFRRNKAANQGGALFVRGSVTLKIKDAFFVENESGFIGGGAIYAENYTNGNLQIQISTTTFSKNAAKNHLGSGGAIRLKGSGITCKINSGSSFISNVAELDGGAIHVSQGLKMNLSQVFFIGNEVRQGAGAALYAISSFQSGEKIEILRLQIHSSTYLQNRAIGESRGGGVLGFTGSGTDVDVESCRFLENESFHGSGGVLYLFDGPLVSVSYSIFSDNRAIGGGVIYAESGARCHILECKFYRNEAEQGGVIRAGSAVGISISKSELRNNTALEAGGVIYAESHTSLLSNRARLSINNSVVTNNSAEIQTISNALDSIATRGGAIVVIGDGQRVDIVNSSFRNNSASEGGGIASIGTKSFLVSNESSFESNEAELGGALYLLIDESVDLSSDTYNVYDAKFLKNDGSRGGAIWIASTSSVNGHCPFNADRTKVRIQRCTFKDNNASNTGGGMMVRGVGVDVSDSNFTRNIANHASDSEMSGSGGAIASMDGARAIIFQSGFHENKAKMSGGALFVNDASVSANGSNFTQNSVIHEFGTGGAVALELTSSRRLPIFEHDGPRQYSILQCSRCGFVKNSAPLYGGAIYHHLSDPHVNYTELWNCNDAHNQHRSNMPRGQEHDVSCAWVHGIRESLEQRSIHLSNLTFEENVAQSGAALFTNHRVIININNGRVRTRGVPFIEVVRKQTFTSEGIIFKNNTVVDSGYGKNYATFPTKASLYNKDNPEGSTNLTFKDFRSGHSFSFEIGFVDDFGQTVAFIRNFTAELYIVGEGSEDRVSPVYGQTTATMEQNGRVNFTSARLSGKENLTYKLALRYLHHGQELRMNETTFVEVIVRPCRIGEVTSRDENDAIECKSCADGQFSAAPSDEDCPSCRGIEGIECHGNVAIPNDEYWQYSSFSTNVQECISREACKYKDRNESIREMTSTAHEAGQNLSFHALNDKQCAPGYKGILCGSCSSTHGKEGDQCRRCASEPLRYLLLFLLLLWSLLLVGFFVRSVLQLSKRIEFNKRFGQSCSEQGTRPLVETLPGTSSTPTELRDSEIHPVGTQYLASGMGTSFEGGNLDQLSPQVQSFMFPSEPPQGDWTQALTGGRTIRRSGAESRRGHLFEIDARPARVKRQTHFATRLHRLQTGQASRNLRPLTLMNPTSEVLKVKLKSSRIHHTRVLVQIMINFLQVTSVAIFINLTWSEEVRRALAVIGMTVLVLPLILSPRLAFRSGLLILNRRIATKIYRHRTLANLSTGGGYFSLDCFLEEQSMAKSLRRMILLVLYPAFIFLVFVLLLGIRTLIKSKSFRYFKHRMWLAFLSILYIFYIGVTKNLLRFFVCRSIKMDEIAQQNSTLASELSGSFWEEDTSVKCYEDDHLLLVGFFVVPLLCLVSIGFPLGTFFILHLKANHLEDDKVVGTYGFLYQAYNKHYWEVVIMLRKASIAAVTVFPQRLGANIQGLLCVFILFVSLVCHLLFRPFKAEAQHLNHLESYSLSATIAVFLSGLVFNDSKTTGATGVLLSIVAILCVIGTLLLMIFNLLMSSEELIDMLLIENGVMNADDLPDQRLSFRITRNASSGRNPVQNQTTGVQMTHQTQNA